MAHYRALGPLFSLAGGASGTWTITYGFGQDVGIVTAAPNIVDDVLGVVHLKTVDQGVGATGDGASFYTVEISNPGNRPVTHNLDLEDWL